MSRLILASASPRRKELLERIGWPFYVEPAADEVAVPLPPAALVRHLALEKAQAVAQRHREDDVVVLGADTVVVHAGRILGKPSDEIHAADMLGALQGSLHEVYTGVALVQGTRSAACVERTSVRMCAMTAADIWAYIATGEPMDKAGAYGVQGRGAAFISRIDGDYTNVVGLPLCAVASALKEFGIKII